MANYLEDLVQNIYTNCDMSGFEDYNRGVQNLSKNMANFNADNIKSQKAQISLLEAQTKSRIRLADYEDIYARKRKRRDEEENFRLTRRLWLWNRIVRLASIYLGFNALRNTFNTASRLQLVQKSIEGLTKSTQDWQFIQQQAFEKGIDIEVVAKGYRNFFSSARMVGFDKQGIQQMYSDMLLSTRAIGASTQQTEGALLALEQMLSKGRVSMEELRRQLGNALPGAFEIGAKAMNMTTAEFNNFVQKVGIASTEFVPKFIKQLKEEYAGGFKGVSETLSFATARLSVAWKLFQLRLFEGESGKNLAKAIDTIAKLIISPQFMKFAQVLGKIVELFAKFVSFSIKYIEYLPLIIGGIMLLTNSFKVLGKEGLLAFGKIAKASLVLYGRWLLLFGVLAVLQDLIYGLFAPEMTDSLTENILRKLGVYKDKPLKTPEQVQREGDIARYSNFVSGKQSNNGAVVYIDEKGNARFIPAGAFSNPAQPNGYLHWSALTKGEQDYFKRHYSQPTPHALPLGSLGYAPTELNKTESFTQQFGDIKIYVVGNGDPQATADSVADKLDIYRRSLTPLKDLYNQ